MRICIEIVSRKLIEAQSGGSGQVDLDTLVSNAVNIGYAAKDVQASYVTDEEYRALLPQPTAEEVAALAAKQSIDVAIGADTTLAQLKAMTNAEFDAWWLVNVTTAAQAIVVLKRLAKLVIRRLL